MVLFNDCYVAILCTGNDLPAGSFGNRENGLLIVSYRLLPVDPIVDHNGIVIRDKNITLVILGNTKIISSCFVFFWGIIMNKIIARLRKDELAAQKAENQNQAF